MLYECTKLLSYLCNGKCCMTLGIGMANGKVFCLHHARVATATVPTNMDIFTSVGFCLHLYVIPRSYMSACW